MMYALVEMGPYLGCDYTAPQEMDNRGCGRPKEEHEPNDRGLYWISHHSFVPRTKPERVVRIVRMITNEEARSLGAKPS